MDLTQGTEKEKIDRSKKMMLWFGIASLIMGFAGWTSAYIVSSSRKDWDHELELPSLFYVSTAIIVFSSLVYFLAKRAAKQNKKQLGTMLLCVTLAMGIAFIYFQTEGFSQMVNEGNYLTGSVSSPKASFIYVIAGVHVIHVLAGIISLLVVLYNQVKGKYSSEEYLGISLGETFWHFLGILWVYLILFMTFVK